jgi:hypothetical protein
LVPILLQVKEKFDFGPSKAYPEEEIYDCIANFMPRILLYSTQNSPENSNESNIDLMENSLK